MCAILVALLSSINLCYYQRCQPFQYFEGEFVWESGRFLSNMYNSMGVASPKIREALKFVQRFTHKSYNFQGVSRRIRETWHLCIMHFFQKLFHILAIFFTHVCIKDHQWVCAEVKAIYSKSGTSFLVLAVNEDFAKTFKFYSSSEILAIILHTINIVHCFSALQTLEHPDMLLFRWGINLTTLKSWWSYTTFL